MSTSPSVHVKKQDYAIIPLRWRLGLYCATWGNLRRSRRCKTYIW